MEILKRINYFFKKLDEDHVDEYTACCAYYTFLSFVPFIILLLSMIKYINIETDTLANIFSIILPNIMKNSVLDIIQEVYSKSSGTVSITAIFMLWSASNSFYALNKGLHAIYKRKKDENFILLRIKAVIGAIVAILLIAFILVVLVFGTSLEEVIDTNFKGLSRILEFVLHARYIISILVMFVIFLFMFRFSSEGGKRSFKDCIFGALFTAIAWYAISFFFSIYVNIFTNFSIIYGSLATITLIMMWLYAIIYVIFIGAEINNIIIERKKANN